MIRISNLLAGLALHALQMPMPASIDPIMVPFARAAPRRRMASAARAQKRANAKAAFLRQIEKERAIGTDPIFANGIARWDRERQSEAWRKRAAEWDRTHGGSS